MFGSPVIDNKYSIPYTVDVTIYKRLLTITFRTRDVNGRFSLRYLKNRRLDPFNYSKTQAYNGKNQLTMYKHEGLMTYLIASLVSI